MEHEIRRDVGTGERLQQFLAYFRLTKIDWTITAIAAVLEPINITPSLLTVLSGVRRQAVVYLFAAFVLLLWRRRFPYLVLIALLVHQALFFQWPLVSAHRRPFNVPADGQ